MQSFSHAPKTPAGLRGRRVYGQLSAVTENNTVQVQPVTQHACNASHTWDILGKLLPKRAWSPVDASIKSNTQHYALYCVQKKCVHSQLHTGPSWLCSLCSCGADRVQLHTPASCALKHRQRGSTWCLCSPGVPDRAVGHSNTTVTELLDLIRSFCIVAHEPQCP